jgi:glycosyltransferase involved in cell wall biosynthesis
MQKKILVSGPLLSASGYGRMCRFALAALKEHEDQFDIYVNPTTWGQTGWLFEENEEYRYINSLRAKTQQYVQGGGQFDIALQITIPNEWKRMAPVNIGYTAGIETHVISPAWLEPSNMMDKIITISQFSKSGFVNTVFGNDKGQQFRVTTPIDVVHFPVEEVQAEENTLSLPSAYNFLTVNQWGPRKNMETLIKAFVDEFRDEDVGLVIKANTANDSIMDKTATESRLTALLASLGARKCRVHLLHGRMTDEAMAGLYRHNKIKAFVTATHGEGFGFPIFEAVNAGLPVIATDWSGHLDFLTGEDDKKLFAKVDFELKQIDHSHVWPGVMEAQAAWAYPTVGSLRSRMREVYKDGGRFNSWAKKLAAHNKQKFAKQKINFDFIEAFSGERPSLITLDQIPKISVITSVYKGDEHIKGFLEDITRQSIFREKCELILINAASPGNEEEVIKEYVKKYPNNIVYKKLDSDPGIYACWNIAAKLATGEYLTNANLDDRKSPEFLEKLAKELVSKAEVDVVYADNLLTNIGNETWENNTAKSTYPSEQFSLEAMLRGNPPHCMPMWRKSLHDKYGYFEEGYRSASDWEFWLRCAFGGVKMSKLNNLLGLYYFNPKGMSTNTENASWKRQEEKEIFKKYMQVYKNNQGSVIL